MTVYEVIGFMLGGIVGTVMYHAVAGCTPTPRPVPPPSEACEAAAANLAQLQCLDDLGQPTWGDDYAQMCAHFEANGVYVGQDCLAVLDNCRLLGAARQTPRGEPCPM